MKTAAFFLSAFLLSVLPASAQSSVETAQAALSAEQWTLVNAALIEQREAINAAHLAGIAAQAASQQETVARLTTQLAAAQAAQQRAEAAQQRAEAKLKLLVDGAKDALSKPTIAERLAAGNALLAQVQSSQSDEEKAALLKQQAEIAAKLEALEAAK